MEAKVRQRETDGTLLQLQCDINGKTTRVSEKKGPSPSLDKRDTSRQDTPQLEERNMLTKTKDCGVVRDVVVQKRKRRSRSAGAGVRPMSTVRQ